MTWLYEQSTGRMRDAAGDLVGVGYSGHDSGKNNPRMQDVADVGPIPVGLYKIMPPVDTPTHGPFVLPLEPVDGTDTFGRSGFLCHGDSIPHPGTASKGCIIQSRDVREKLAASGDLLQVVSGQQVVDLDGEISV